MSNVVHVVGTGTIGEPLVGLLATYRSELGIDEVTFYKHTPRATDRPMIRALRAKGAKLAVAPEKRADFEKLGIKPDLDWSAALADATVVIDCTPEDSGLANKAQHYERLANGKRWFLAQGSEEGFGKMFALGVNDNAFDPAKDHFVHVVSCNTHNISMLVKCLGIENGTPNLDSGNFVCIRRASDVGEETSIQAPKVEKHKEANGTHHATDVVNLYRTLGLELPLFSSAMKLNTPYMHTLHFHLRLKHPTTKAKVVEKIQNYKYAAWTEKQTTNSVFAMGREHGPFGRILNQTVVSLPTLHVSADGKDVLGFAFTPQDGNVLLSNLAVVTRALHPQDWEKRLGVFDRFLWKEW
ncbi:MAG: hypothetical protein ACYDCK_13500 [Thermoplasmatota archaeon]